MSQSLHFLLLEDSALDAEFLLDQLEEGGLKCDSVRVETRDAFEKALSSKRFDVILADYSLPLFNGMEALGIAKELQPEVPFIFVSGRLGEELAIDSLQRGATDYVVKQRLERLVPAVKRALGEASERLERRRIEATLSLLSDASIVFSSSLDYQTTLSSIARLAVPHFADCCMVDIIGDNGALRRLDVVHVDESKKEWAEKMRAFSPSLQSQRHPLPRVIRKGNRIYSGGCRRIGLRDSLTSRTIEPCCGKLKSPPRWSCLWARGEGFWER